MRAPAPPSFNLPSSSSSPLPGLPSSPSSSSTASAPFLTLGPNFESNMVAMLSTMKVRLAEHGTAWPQDWPDPDRYRDSFGVHPHGGRPMVADMRPIMATLAAVSPSPAKAPGTSEDANREAATYAFVQQMLPTYLLCTFGFATTDVCMSFMTGSTALGLKQHLPAMVGVQSSQQAILPAKRKGRCADLLPPAPPPPPIPPPLPSLYETRGISWNGHLLMPNALPRGARMSSKAAAAHSATLWPAWGPQPRTRPHRPDLDVTQQERRDATSYLVGGDGWREQRVRNPTKKPGA